jgi:HPt (histidine-containing phosphotransfer) domain-containing protein
MTDPIDVEAFERLVDITGGDLAFIDELVDTYLEDGASQITALREASAAGDPAGVIRPAHTLKSSSANVGALVLAEACRSLEADGRAGAVPDLATRVEDCARGFEAARSALLAIRADRPSAG